MSLTQQDLNSIEKLVLNAVSANNKVLEEKIKNSILENNDILEEKMQKMIDTAHAEQMELMFKNFVSKEEFFEELSQVRDILDRHSNEFREIRRLVDKNHVDIENIRVVTADNSYRISFLESQPAKASLDDPL